MGLDNAIAALDTRLGGHIVTPALEGYDEARRIWNGAIDRQPAAIVACADTRDVGLAIRFARAHDLPLAVRGGGHSVAGHGVCDGGLVIDLGGLRGVRVDPSARRAIVGGGATWADVDRATAAHGLAVTGGLISSTGVGGLTLGGGIGWLMRRHGLTCDHLVAAEIVDCEGVARGIDADTRPELLWGLRGGGGNFGVVTSFEFALNQVDTVIGGQLMWPADRASEVGAAFLDLVSRAPAELTSLLALVTAPPAPFVPEPLRGRPAVAIVSCHLGTAAQAQADLAPLRELRPALDDVRPRPYVDLQCSLDEGAPPGLHYFWRSHFFPSLDEAGLRALLQAAEGCPSPLTQVHLHHLGGAVADRDPSDSAYAHRGAAFAFNVAGGWSPSDPAEPNRRWVEAVAEAMAPWSTGASYVNFLGDAPDARVRAAYGEGVYDRLRRLKRRWDPDNVFSHNANIPPAD